MPPPETYKSEIGSQSTMCQVQAGASNTHYWYVQYYDLQGVLQKIMDATDGTYYY